MDIVLIQPKQNNIEMQYAENKLKDVKNRKEWKEEEIGGGNFIL